MEEDSFLDNRIRQTARNRKRYYSVIDIVAGVTGSKNPRDYWYRVKQRRGTESNVDLSTLCRRLRLPGPDGKRYFTDCVDRDGISLDIEAAASKGVRPASPTEEIQIGRPAKTSFTETGGRAEGSHRSELSTNS